MWPLWSPAGDRMVGEFLRVRKVFLMDLSKPWAEQQPRVLEGITTAQDWLQPISWSRDGRYLAGMILAQDRLLPQVAIYDLETGRRQTVAEAARGVAWLPDSKHLLIAAPRGLRILQPWTGKVDSLSLPEAADITNLNFALSGDGRTICFTIGESEADIWMLTPE
jgi:Tol biopolymer transport system component